MRRVWIVTPRCRDVGSLILLVARQGYNVNELPFMGKERCTLETVATPQRVDPLQ